MSRRPAIALAGLALVGYLSGCTLVHDVFTNPTGSVTIPRQRFIDTYATARQLYVTIRAGVEAMCLEGKLLPTQCARAVEVDQEARQLDFAIKAKLAVPESEIDWAMIEKVLGFAVKLVL